MAKTVNELVVQVNSLNNLLIERNAHVKNELIQYIEEIDGFTHIDPDWTTTELLEVLLDLLDIGVDKEGGIINLREIGTVTDSCTPAFLPYPLVRINNVAILTDAGEALTALPNMPEVKELVALIDEAEILIKVQHKIVETLTLADNAGVIFPPYLKQIQSNLAAADNADIIAWGQLFSYADELSELQDSFTLYPVEKDGNTSSVADQAVLKLHSVNKLIESNNISASDSAKIDNSAIRLLDIANIIDAAKLSIHDVIIASGLENITSSDIGRVINTRDVVGDMSLVSDNCVIVIQSV